MLLLNDRGWNVPAIAELFECHEHELCSFLVYGGKRRKGVSCWIKENTRPGIHHE
jgi:hypothetical protein